MTGVVSTLSVVAGISSGCGTDSAADGLNGPCTRDDNCIDGLRCAGGVCTPVDAEAVDATGHEGGASDGDDGA
jgi:hypothetical protein